MNLFLRIILWGVLMRILKDAERTPVSDSYKVEVNADKTSGKFSIRVIENAKTRTKKTRPVKNPTLFIGSARSGKNVTNHNK